MTFPSDYEERVYAGVLGKIIGVYLGRPFEGASYEWLTERFGQIDRYVHEDQKVPLIVADDDISGTFTFVRALQDFDYSPDLTPDQIGRTWLNYIIENRTILWWGGMGRSTEHTAYLRMRQGITAPECGSIAANGQVVAEQIGAQIFIDAWGMVNPGDPAKAADFARGAGSVSHDGEAIYGAQIVAALVAAAFVESDIDILLDTAVAQIPVDSVIARLIADLREWHAAEPDWRITRAKIAAKFGYDKYGGGCHMIPNHALIVHALLHGGGDISESLKIVNTCGWDTDCNSGNVGAILGVRNGLAGFAVGYDWRGPVADRMILPTADGGRFISDAVIETREIVCAAKAVHGEAGETAGPRYRFEFSGSVQGFIAETDTLAVSNPSGDGLRLTGTGRAATPTFLVPSQLTGGGYALEASPTLYEGQTVEASVDASAPASVRLFVRHYDADDKPVTVDGALTELSAGARQSISWTIPSTDGRPIFEIGVEVVSATGEVTLRSLDWDGAPTTEFATTGSAKTHRTQWVNAVDNIEGGQGVLPLIKNVGRGVISIGTAVWGDYTASATLSTHLSDEVGLVARYQGLERYYAVVLLRSGKARLIKRYYEDIVLAESAFALALDTSYAVTITAQGARITATVDGRELFAVTDTHHQLMSGGMGVLVTNGRVDVKQPRVVASTPSPRRLAYER